MAKYKWISDEMINEILTQRSRQVVKDMSKVSRDSIYRFYSDYKPDQYERVYGLKDLFHISITRKHNRISIIFKYSADLVHGWHRSAEDAFETGFVYGAHGGIYAWGHPKDSLAYTSPSPWETIVKYASRNYKRW